MKKLLFFVVLLVSAVLVTAGAYAETKEVYVKDGDYTPLTVVEETPDVFGASRLSTPKNLKWNQGGLKGSMQWDVVPGCEGKYYIEVLCNGEEVFSTTWSELYDHNGSGVINVDVVGMDVFNRSGKYTFSVKALGDGTRYLDSSAAYSASYSYTLPSSKLSAPKNLRWDDEGYLTHSAVKNAGGYKYNIYNQNKECIADTSYSESEPITDLSDVEEYLADYLVEICGWEEGIEAFYITVNALTYNIEKYQSSAESAFSARIPVGDIKAEISGSLDDMLDGAYDGNISANEALSGFLSGMEKEGTTNTELAMNMQQDSSITDKIGQLESLYCDEMGIDVSIKNQAGSGYLEERGIDVDKVEIVGAGLNSQDGNDVSLNFYKADSSVSADELFFKNSVAVDISMDGVRDAKKLEIPVQIKMPVPKGVIPDRLTILHYHADGSMDEISPSITTEGGVNYATFVLTSFSTFVFCNEEEATITVKVNSEDEFTMSGGRSGSFIAAALYKSDGAMKSAKILDPKESMDIVFSDAESTDYVKVMWIDGTKTLSPVCEYKPIIIK